jgi:hypothetical protein
MEKIQQVVKEKLRPHAQRVEEGHFDDYDVLPAVFALLIEKQEKAELSNTEQMQDVKATILDCTKGLQETIQRLFTETNNEIVKTKASISDDIQTVKAATLDQAGKSDEATRHSFLSLIRQLQVSEDAHQKNLISIAEKLDKSIAEKLARITKFLWAIATLTVLFGVTGIALYLVK